MGATSDQIAKLPSPAGRHGEQDVSASRGPDGQSARPDDLQTSRCPGACKIKLVVALTVMLGASLSIGSFMMIRSAERHRVAAELRLATGDTAAAMEQQLEAQLAALQSLEYFFLASEHVTEQEFAWFCKPLLSRKTRPSEFAFIVGAGDGRYHVKRFAAADGHQHLLDDELTRRPAFLAAADEARKTGRPVFSERLALVTESGEQHGLLVLAAVYDTPAQLDTRPAEGSRLRGYVAELIFAGEAMEGALNELEPRGLDVAVRMAGDDGEGDQFLYYHPSRRHEQGGAFTDRSAPPGAGFAESLSATARFDVGGQKFLIDCRATGHFASQHAAAPPWALLCLELVATGGAAWYVWKIARDRARKRHLNDRLQEINRNLSREADERIRAERELSLAGKVFANSGEAIVITDAENRILSVNRAFTEMTGYSEEEVAGENPRILKSDRHKDKFYRRMWAQIIEADCWQGEIWNRRKDGEAYLAWLTINTVRNDAGEIINYIAVASDMTHRKQAEQRIEFLAYYDPLTDLPNRSLLHDRISQAIGDAARAGMQVAVLFMDLDRFKNVNDSLGHRVGDLLLQEVARRLRGAVRATDTVARTGGDEFVIVLPGGDQPADAAKVARKIQAAVRRPMHLEGHDLRVATSIGISLYPDDGADVDELMKNADTAMYHGKAAGHATYQFFAREMNAGAVRRLNIESQLRSALERDELELFFQPQVRASDGQIVGAEALIRWNHPGMGRVSPGAFIPIAEESDLIVRIGEWCLIEACRINSKWQHSGFRTSIPVAVNISPLQFRQSGFLRTVSGALAQAGLDPKWLELEITEGAIVQDPADAARQLRDIKTAGVRLAIDDFGTGYSNLSYLKQFPLDKLKIDQSFVRGVSSDTQDAAVVVTIINLARGLQLTAIAEGVETPEQFAFLRKHGCDEIQGYLFGKPMPADEFAQLLQGAGRLGESLSEPDAVGADER